MAREEDINPNDVDNGELLNLDQPLFSEVWRVGKNYEEWVHKPSMKKSFRMFHSDFVENFASTPWYVVPIFWIPVVYFMAMFSIGTYASADDVAEFEHEANSTNSTAFSYTNPEFPNGFGKVFTDAPLNRQQLIAHILFGLIEWTLTEYVLHRFLFHTPVSGDSAWLITTHFVLHGQHHKFPMDRGRLVFPVIPAIVVTASIYWSLTRVFFSFYPGIGVQCGFLIGYIAYDMTHYYTHFGRPTWGYLAKLKKSHMKHHFKDIKHGFGISSEIWDHVFGTQWPTEPTKKIE